MNITDLDMVQAKAAVRIDNPEMAEEQVTDVAKALIAATNSLVDYLTNGDGSAPPAGLSSMMDKKGDKNG